MEVNESELPFPLPKSHSCPPPLSSTASGAPRDLSRGPGRRSRLGTRDDTPAAFDDAPAPAPSSRPARGPRRRAIGTAAHPAQWSRARASGRRVASRERVPRAGDGGRGPRRARTAGPGRTREMWCRVSELLSGAHVPRPNSPPRLRSCIFWARKGSVYRNTAKHAHVSFGGIF